MTQNATSESLRFAGDVSIRKLQLVSSNNFAIDITDQMIEIEMHEDLFSPFITMTIVVRESLDFINALPLRGEEIINVEFSTPTFTVENTIVKSKFYVYKLSDRQLLTDRNSVYALHCISYEALTDLNVKQSRAFKGNIGNIAESLIKADGLNTTKKYTIEPTKNATKYVSNYWSPIKNLNFIAANALNKNNSATYLFFENRSGFNFVSLDSLYSQKTYQVFTKDNYARDTEGNLSFKNLDRDYKRILEFRVKTLYDSLKNTNSGAYASRLFAYDIVRKKYFAKDYTALNDFSKVSHLNTLPLYTKFKPVNPVNYIQNEVRHYASHNGFVDTSNILFEQSRNSAIQVLRSSVIEIEVFGRTDYTVGQKMRVEVPKPTVITKSDEMNTNGSTGIIDNTYSGNYIVTAINHVISRSKHTCILELSKESMIQ
jgi:hypothetical protein